MSNAKCGYKGQVRCTKDSSKNGLEKRICVVEQDAISYYRNLSVHAVQCRDIK